MPTLEEVVENIPEIGLFQSSELVSPMGGKIVNLNGENFEVRFFFFQDTRSTDQKLPFKDYLKNTEKSKVSGKVMDLGYGKIIAFSPSDEEKEEGVHYMLSLRPLNSNFAENKIG